MRGAVGSVWRGDIHEMSWPLRGGQSEPYSNVGAFVLETVEAYGDDVAFQVRRGVRTERITFREAGEHVMRVAGWLMARGLRPGDRIAVWSPNMPEYALLYFGAWYAGVVVVPIDVRTTQVVADRFVAASEPKIGFKSRHVLGTFPAAVRTVGLEDLLDLVAEMRPLYPPPDVRSADLCEIAYTSGTTGLPKGVMLTHGNLLAELRALRTAFPLQRDYRALSLLPLSHSLEQAINLLLAFSFGVSMTYVPRPNPVTIARSLRAQRITCLVLVPELLRLLLNGIERRARLEGRWGQYQWAHRVAPRLPMAARRLLFHRVHQALGGHLKFFGCGGARLDASLAQAWERMGIRVYEGYGLTETTGAATINSPSQHRAGTVGKPLPGVELRLDADGEIAIRGPNVSPGYFNAPDLTAQSWDGEWFRTGDIGEVNTDGFVRLIGRRSFRLVLADGRNVYPEDLERVLNEHPLVRESCVVGVPRHGDDTVHAVLLLESPGEPEQIVRETNRRVDDHQRIASVSVWPDEDFPRTPTLKINRALVRQSVLGDRAPEVAHPAPGGESQDVLARILARVAEVPAERVHDRAELGADLGIDSIGRVDLVASIEEELGRVVDESRVSAETSVAELRDLVTQAGVSAAAEPGAAEWPRSRWARAVRPALHRALFRVQDRWLRFEIVHPERLETLPAPAIYTFNYQGPYAALAVLRALPEDIRLRTAVAADARLWQGGDRWQGLLGGLVIQAFPMVKSGGAVRASLEEFGAWLDAGYSVIMSPEGNPERDGELLPFLPGTGLLSVEMRVPVVPFRLDGYHRLFPRDPQFPFLPHRRGRVRLIVGQPLSFPRGLLPTEATEMIRQATLELH